MISSYLYILSSYIHIKKVLKLSPTLPTHDSTYKTETMLELYDTDDFTEGMFPLYFEIIYRNQQQYNLLLSKIKCAEYQKGSFCRGQSAIEILAYRDKISIPLKLQGYLVNGYHVYILHTGLDRT